MAGVIDRPHRTIYSETVEGDRGNFYWPVRFDETQGHVGITQYEGETVTNRVLLSPAQVKALVAFAKATQKGE